MLSNIYKPFTPKLSASVLRSMVKEYKTQVRHGRPKWRNVKPGMVMFFRYDAKHKEYTYDKYPITLIFWKKGKYMLGLNFHWVEAHARIRLIQAIIKVNTHNGKINYPLKFDYRKLLPHLKGKAFSLNGSERLLKRPLDVYEKLCDERGMIFSNNGVCITVKGPLEPGDYTLDGGVSSQFISGLLFALPLLNGDSRIRLTGRIESRSYIDLTVSALKQFGVIVSWEDDRTLFIKGGQKYGGMNTRVEGDYSNAAFLDAFNLLEGEVDVTGLSDDSLQGDRVYKEHLEALKNGTPTISLADCPDLGPVLFALAAALNGATFTDTERLKIKESDRVAAMAQELAKFGAEVVADENKVTIKGGGLKTPNEALNGHNDHRIVMAMAVLASVTGGEITEAEAVRKSFPDFFERLRDIGINAVTTEE